MQKFSSLIGINNTIKQYVNTYENKELLVHLLEKKLEKIELYLKQRNIEGARSQIDIILCKRESIPEELECRLIFLKGNIEIELDNFDTVDLIIESLLEKEEQIKYSSELKYVKAIKLDNEELLREAIDEFILSGEDNITILKRRLKFYFNNMYFHKIIEKVDYIEEYKIKDRDIFYYIAVSYLNIGDNSNAIKYCNRRFEYGDSKLTTYVKTLAEVNPILQRKGLLINISESEKSFLKEKNEILRELIKELPEGITEEVNTIILNIYLVTDLNKAIKFYNANEDKFCKSISGKFIVANIYELSNQFEKAKELYLEIIREDWSEEVFTHIMICMRAMKDHYSYIKLFEKYEEKIEDENFALMEYYLESLKNVGYLEKAIEKLEGIKSYYQDSIRFKVYLAKIETDQKQKLRMLKEAEAKIGESNQYDRLLIKDVYLQMGMYYEVIRISRPLFKNKKVLYLIIQLIIKNKKNEFYLDLIYEIDKHNDIRLLEYKRFMLGEINELLEAKEVAERIYELEANRKNLVDLIQLKININDNIGLESLITELLPLESPQEYMIIAYAYITLGNINSYEDYSYESIFKLKGAFDKNIFENYIHGNLRLSIEGIKEKRILDMVKEDSVVHLINENMKVNICLNSESKYQTNEQAFGCIHISKDNPLWLELISQRKGDIISFNNQKFEIDSIIDKYTVVFRYCLNELESNEIDFGFVSFSIEEIEEKVKEFTMLNKESIKNISDRYNFRDDNIGLPFSRIFFDEDVKKSIEIFNHMLITEENNYYIGSFEDNINDDTYILSYQTLLLLEYYDILDIVIRDSESYYIPNKLKLKIIEAYSDIKKNQKSSYLNYDSETGLFIEEIDNKMVLNKLNRIIGLISKINTSEVDYKVRSNLMNLSRKFINEFEIETIYLAKELKGVLIIDDLFIRKLINSNEDTKHIKHTNIVIILDELYIQEPVKYYIVVKNMIEDNIKYVLNRNHFKRLMLEYKDYGYNIDYFREIINSMKSDEYYREIILEACKEIVDLNLQKYLFKELILVTNILNLD